jgi:uncharacterized protein (DUF1684 family)
MKKIIFSIFLGFCCITINAQFGTYKRYKNPHLDKNSFTARSIAFQEKYVEQHEVVALKDKKYFRFFKPAPYLNINASFTKIDDTSTVTIKTSGKRIPEQYFIRYGKLTFTIDSVAYQLTVFQSKDLVNNAAYRDYLFLPFGDKTNGNSTYGTGRYIDLLITDIKDGKCTIDFNKAYNPYCAYSNDYNCPIPPKENRLPIIIEAGEENFQKPKKH